MNLIQLYIENEEIELTTGVQFAITKQFEDLANPSIIINDWSKTISIPFSEKNNRIFGHIYNPDKIIVDGGTDNIGIYFNPTKKLNFRLVHSSNVIMEGYAKMNSVNKKGKSGTYNITLNGELGKVFQELKKITFDEKTEDTDYLIDGSQYIDAEITKDLVKASWESSGQTTSSLTDSTITDIIGFAPNNAFDENFDYTTFQLNDSESMKLVDVLEEQGERWTNLGISADSVIPDGMTPRGLGEYRSYLQLPYIYWNKLWQIFQAKAEEITGYEFEMDSDWFNTNNPYWYNLVYMLKKLESNENITIVNKYSGISQTEDYPLQSLSSFAYKYHYDFTRLNECYWNIVKEAVPCYDNNTNTFNLIDSAPVSITGNMSLLINFKAILQKELTSDTEVRMGNDRGLVITYYTYDGTTQKELGRYLICSDDSVLNKSQYNDYITIAPTTVRHINDYISTSGIINITKMFQSIAQHNYKVYMKVDGVDETGADYVNLFQYKTSGGALAAIHFDLLKLQTYWVDANFELTTIKNKSYSYFTLNTLWNKDYNIFEEILKYCKMYRILIEADYINKKLRFMPAWKFFDAHTVNDWTDKLDISKDFNITPCTFDKKYVLFNYKDNETKLGSEYLEKYGVDFGEKRINTDYNFNQDTEELFTDINGSMTYTDNVLSWNRLYNAEPEIVYSFPAEIYIYCKDKDGKYVDTFGQFYFHCGLSNFDTQDNLKLRSVVISDDTAFQQLYQKYYYSQDRNSVSVSTYPHLDVVCGNNLCLFNVPSENYTYLANYEGKLSIFDAIWKDYINERYNIQSKKVECYLNITPTDFASFKFNNLVKIGNQLYMINKISDYDVAPPATTKVEMVSIQDITNYIKHTY